MIDFHSLFLFQKLDWIRRDECITKYDPYTVQEVISMINNRYGYDMQKHVALQRLIDAQFVVSRMYFKVLFTIYLLGFVFPFII